MKPVLILVVLLIVVGGGWYWFGRNPDAPKNSVQPANQTTSQSEKLPAAPKAEGTKTAEKAVTTTTAAAPAAGGVGSLKGVVKYVGVAPKPAMLNIPPDHQKECHNQAIVDESLLVDPASNGIKWVIIRILDINPKDGPPKLEKPLELDQKGCTFTPRVIVTPPAHDLTILNPDKMTHNVHTLPHEFINPEKNFIIAANQLSETYKAAWLDKPEIVEVKCDIHGWMKGFILVHDPRYCAVTGADGKFEIKEIPAVNVALLQV